MCISKKKLRSPVLLNKGKREKGLMDPFATPSCSACREATDVHTEEKIQTSPKEASEKIIKPVEHASLAAHFEQLASALSTFETRSQSLLNLHRHLRRFNQSFGGILNAVRFLHFQHTTTSKIEYVLCRCRSKVLLVLRHLQWTTKRLKAKDHPQVHIMPH
jgi:hypothetical protein